MTLVDKMQDLIANINITEKDGEVVVSSREV